MNLNNTQDNPDDWEKALKGQPVSDAMTAEEQKLVSDIREEILWGEAIKGAGQIPAEQTERSWQSFQKRLQSQPLPPEPPPVEPPTGSATVHAFPNRQQTSASRQQWAKYLPIAASLAAISVSLYVLVQSQFDDGLIGKGVPDDSGGMISKGIPQYYTMTEPQMQSMLSELIAAGLQIGVAKNPSQSDKPSNEVTIHLNNLNKLTEENRALLDKFSISVTPNAESQVLIIELTQP